MESLTYVKITNIEGEGWGSIGVVGIGKQKRFYKPASKISQKSLLCRDLYIVEDNKLSTYKIA